MVRVNSTKQLYTPPTVYDSPTHVFKWYLSTSYLYYKQNISFVSDKLYDSWCVYLAYNWDSFEHQHKHLITKNDLLAGTGYAIQYPTQVQHAALYLLNQSKRT